MVGGKLRQVEKLRAISGRILGRSIGFCLLLASAQRSLFFLGLETPLILETDDSFKFALVVVNALVKRRERGNFPWKNLSFEFKRGKGNDIDDDYDRRYDRRFQDS